MAECKIGFKMKVVKEYLEENMGYRELAKKYSIPARSTVRIWINTYESQGYEGLEIKRKNSKYSFEFGLSTINLYLTGEMSYRSLANELKINSPSMIVRWVREFREEGIEGLRSEERGGPSDIPDTGKDEKIKNGNDKTKGELNELEKLGEENYCLRMEVDILKKRFNSHKRQNQK